MNAYYNGYKRSGVAKVHVVRPTPVGRYVNTWRAGDRAWCGVFATSTDASPKVAVDPAKPLEPGLNWCGHCLGRAADHAELLVEVAALLIEKEATP